MTGPLTDLADVCRRTGYLVLEVDGWQSRGRSGAGGHQSGGYTGTAPGHVMVHHTASGPGSDGWPDVNYMTFSADAAPLTNLYVDRAGTIYVCAAMATNTNGSGIDPCGRLAPDSMNADAIGIECGNDGTGEHWPAVQLDCLTVLAAELGAAYAVATACMHGHAEYAPTRKIDPAGPDRYASGGQTWDMPAFRADVAGTFPPPPLPDPEVDAMRYVYTPDGSRGPMLVGAGWRYWARNEHEAAVMAQLYGDPIALSAAEYDLAAAIHTAASDGAP